MFQEIFNDIKNSSIQWVLTPAITLWRFESPLGFQLPKWKLTWECGVHSLTFSYTLGNMKYDSWASFLAHTFASPCFGCEHKAKVAITKMVNVVPDVRLEQFLFLWTFFHALFNYHFNMFGVQARYSRYFTTPC